MKFSVAVEAYKRRAATIIFKTTGLAHSYCRVRSDVSLSAAVSMFDLLSGVKAFLAK